MCILNCHPEIGHKYRMEEIHQKIQIFWYCITKTNHLQLWILFSRNNKNNHKLIVMQDVLYSKMPTF